jgi:hypothetical protein
VSRVFRLVSFWQTAIQLEDTGTVPRQVFVETSEVGKSVLAKDTNVSRQTQMPIIKSA